MAEQNSSTVDLADYIDLTQSYCDLTRYTIQASGSKCIICENDSPQESSTFEFPTGYKGFILAKSEKGEAYTICDINFWYSSKDNKYATRPTFKRTNKDLHDKRVNKGQYYQRIAFDSGQNGYREFWKMIAFLGKFNETIDVGEFLGQFKVASADDTVMAIKDKDESQRINYVLDLVKKSDLSEEDLGSAILHENRRKGLEEFANLLNEDNFKSKYRESYDVKQQGDEALWQHFFKNNQWIFGLNLDLRLISDLLREQSVGNSNASNQGNPKVDFLGYSDFTTLIEIKTPDTKFFTATKQPTARANTWSFSSEFIDGVSQCLAQKDDWSKNSSGKSVVDENRKELDNGKIRTVDPRAVFIIGNKEKELDMSSTDADIRQKRDTLERFIRNNKNISIVSFDELYARARFIVNDPNAKGVGT